MEMLFNQKIYKSLMKIFHNFYRYNAYKNIFSVKIIKISLVFQHLIFPSVRTMFFLRNRFNIESQLSFKGQLESMQPLQVGWDTYNKKGITFFLSFKLLVNNFHKMSGNPEYWETNAQLETSVSKGCKQLCTYFALIK